MKSVLLPIFRNKSQEAVLTEAFLHVSREYSLTDPALASGVSLPTAQREADVLAKAGICTDARLGNVRLVAANPQSRYFNPLRELIERAFGPVERLKDGLRGIPEVVEAFLFGSYAARLEGVPGKAPGDVDVAVVTSGDGWPVYELCSVIGRDLDLQVNATVISPQEWADLDNAFLRNVRSQPRVEVLGGPDRTTRKGSQ